MSHNLKEPIDPLPISSESYELKDRRKSSSLNQVDYLPQYSDELGKKKGRQGKSVVGVAKRTMDILVEHGVEERGIDPRPENERDELNKWTYLPQFTLWAAWNTNILSFSEGVIGPSLFGLDWKTSCLCIVFFTAASALPVAYCATNGPKTGMRQMVQARYGMGYGLALIYGILNCATMIGFMALTAILAGQCLALASNSTMSWDVGIVIAALIALILSFVGLKALHIVSLASFPVMIILYVVLAGVVGDKLHLVQSDVAKAATAVTASGVLGYGASLIGFSITYTSLASDFTTSLPPQTPSWKLFLCVYVGMIVPMILCQMFGAACQLAAYSIPDWETASNVGVPNLIYTMTGNGNGASRFVMVLFCLSVVANTAPTIYSAGLSGQVAIPWLVRVPRYFLALVVSAIYLPIAICGASKFYSALENFSSVLSYWSALYIPPTLIEPIIFRGPVSRKTYPVEIWNQIGKLPIGLAAIFAAICGIPVVTGGMAQSWWTGWIARKIEGTGDIAFEIGFVVVGLIYIPARYLERKFTGR
ncbi:cytosine-purine permease [Cryptococcus neoformans c45]|nr:cytosine-purine permease [Cryptococcus neoformans var. grubii c45]